MFFDDKNILTRSGLTRAHGTPKQIAVYQDPVGLYHMIAGSDRYRLICTGTWSRLLKY